MTKVVTQRGEKTVLHPFALPTVRKLVNLNGKSATGDESLSVVQNSEVVRYSGAVNELCLWDFQSVH